MRLLWNQIARHRVLLGTVLCATCICLALVSFVDRWAPQQQTLRRKPQRVNDPSLTITQSPESKERYWEKTYEDRVQRVRNICEKDEITAIRRIWRVAANRRFGKEAHCNAKMCPIIIDEQKVLFFCFIPKVASTLVKRFFINISDIAVNQTLNNNRTAFHFVANHVLKRISPMYYPSTTINRFFKIMFVRHPFDRLVSAIKDKAERPKSEVQYFYDKYWDPVMKKLRPSNASRDRFTFPEFVWYLTHSFERDFDEHWSPYWSRCNPCLVDYDFIGKVETAEHDFPYAFQKVGIESSPEWWIANKTSPRAVTLRYFSTVSEEAIRQLYKIYRMDFELFAYSVDEFLPGNRTVLFNNATLRKNMQAQ